MHTFTPFTQAGDETSSEEEDDEDDEPKKKKRVRAVHRTSDIAMALLSFDNLFYVSSFVLRCKITTFASAIASIMVLPTPTLAFGHTHMHLTHRPPCDTETCTAAQFATPVEKIGAKNRRSNYGRQENRSGAAIE